jgi:hypothetical protein
MTIGTTETPRPRMKAESIMALLRRELPPSRWLKDDTTNDEELVEDIKHLSAARQDRMIHLYQLLRHGGPKHDSIEELLQADNRELWTKHRILTTIGDFRDIGWAKLVFPDYDPAEPHYVFRGVADGPADRPLRLWNPWRDGIRRLPASKFGGPVEINLECPPVRS